MYLRQNNAIYSDTEIALDNIPSDLLSQSAENENDKTVERSDCLEGDQNFVDFHRFNSQETIMISNSPTSGKLGIASGEGSSRDQFLMTIFARN